MGVCMYVVCMDVCLWLGAYVCLCVGVCVCGCLYVYKFDIYNTKPITILTSLPISPLATISIIFYISSLSTSLPISHNSPRPLL